MSRRTWQQTQFLSVSDWSRTRNESLQETCQNSTSCYMNVTRGSTSDADVFLIPDEGFSLHWCRSPRLTVKWTSQQKHLRRYHGNGLKGSRAFSPSQTSPEVSCSVTSSPADELLSNANRTDSQTFSARSEGSRPKLELHTDRSWCGAAELLLKRSMLRLFIVFKP